MKTFFIILGSFLVLGIAAAIALFLFFKNASKVEIHPANSELSIEQHTDQQKIDTIVKYVKNYPNNTQLSFAFIDGDAVSYYGILRKNDTLTTVKNSDSIFQIGSITKVFTSTLLADFVVNEKVDLEEPIQEFLDIKLNNIEKEGKFITLKSLSNHTSGLPKLPSGMMLNSIINSDDPYKKFTQDKFEKHLIEKMSPKTVPGTKMAYSNLGAGLLGHILSSISNKSYEELLQERIFKRFDMTSSSSLPSSFNEDQIVSGLSVKGTSIPAWNFPSMQGMGAIYSNVEDLSKFVTANFSQNETLDFQRIKTFDNGNRMDVALGWMIITAKNNKEYYFHNGATGGYMSSMILDMDTKKGVVILSNVNFKHPDSKKLDRLCFKLVGM
ncbi:serine hydrolase domain-containing protein [Aquimarina sp. 2201CG5-10]|uniref:serine hydrolase domain-containing protein n=1 Tax=Aquimarina callyspongiae TaxID=3098150 RepID=UPI002AB48AF4|nr:serine hydrolase domain-containing protein [Aquimarina sp. 2201CG5-10]MDY8134082.1 serine hydrolase domain-containing protein [Aquimarina sp. 2201CG5-10]